MELLRFYIKYVVNRSLVTIYGNSSIFMKNTYIK